MQYVKSLLAGALLFAAAMPAGATMVMWLEPIVATGAPGDIVTFDLMIDTQDERGLYSWQLDLTFDSSVIDFIGATEGPFLASNGDPTAFSQGVELVGVVDNMLGTILGASPGVTGVGKLAEIQFRIVGSDGDVSSVQIVNALARDDFNQPRPLEVNGARVRVRDTEVPEPTTLGLLLAGTAALMARRRKD